MVPREPYGHADNSPNAEGFSYPVVSGFLRNQEFVHEHHYNQEGLANGIT